MHCHENKNIMNSFVKPFVGTNYKAGICGKKILVLGASFYCSMTSCSYFAECTNPRTKDSSKFDNICLDPIMKGKRLSNYPTIAIKDQYKAYRNFARFIQSFIGEEDTLETWNRMAFTDYLQFFSPTVITNKDYLSKRDFDAFIETVIDLRPDIIVTWGVAIVEEIREKNTFVFDKDKLADSEYYICHMRIPKISHDIALVNCYHPSSRYWYQDMEKLKKYMRIVLE